MSVTAIALSGGADSMVLLHKTLQTTPKDKLVCLHYNHKWSPQEDLDCDWVFSYCTQLGLTTSYRANTTGDKTETVNRQLRYAFLEDRCRAYGATRLLMGHHKDDQVETVLYRMCRGTGIDGLAGIPQSRDLYPGCVIERPLLHMTKQDILDYAEYFCLEYITDMSNFDTTKHRNLIRHEVSPLLEKINPQYRDAISRLASLANQDSKLVDILVTDKIETVDYQSNSQGWSLDYNKFMSLDELLRDRIWIKLDRLYTSSKRLETVKLSLANKTTLNLKGGWVISHKSGRVWMTKYDQVRAV